MARAILFSVFFLFILLHAGVSALGEMPSAGEVVALGLATTGTVEDPLSSTTESTLGTPTVDALSTHSITAKSLASDTVGSSTSGQGFSLSHGFPLIPGKIVSRIQKWEFINMSELLPNNLELACRSV